MNEIKCPNCSVFMPQIQLDSGWCEECGHKIPLFIYEQFGGKSPDEKTLSKIHWDKPRAAAPAEERENLAGWKIALIGVAVVGIVIVIIAY